MLLAELVADCSERSLELRNFSADQKCLDARRLQSEKRVVAVATSQRREQRQRRRRAFFISRQLFLPLDPPIRIIIKPPLRGVGGPDRLGQFLGGGTL